MFGCHYILAFEMLNKRYFFEHHLSDRTNKQAD